MTGVTHVFPETPESLRRIRNTGAHRGPLRPKDGTISTTPAHRHWHVAITLSGDPVEPLLVRAALLRLSEERPFLESMRFSGERAEIQFWDEGESMLDVASLALRLWSEHRDSAGLPRWEVVGLEVVEKGLRERGSDSAGSSLRSTTMAPIAF